MGALASALLASPPELLLLPSFVRTSFTSIARSVDQLPAGFMCLLVDEEILEPPDVNTATAPAELPEPEAPKAIANLVVYPIDPLSRRFSLGRSHKNEVVILDRRISGAHAVLEPAYPRTFWLTDVGSSNGTTVAGRPVVRGPSGRVMLTAGATFTLAGVPIGLIDKQQLASIAAAGR